MIKRVTKFVNEVKVELKKVSWSSKEEMMGSTVVVLVSVAIMAVYIGIWDFILSKVINILIR
ncbi:MAG: preprotein translocase subunit SecE [Candidatus Omnitrophica bacterium]|nr:preprotein translocase subunit SecE [Candidatus Omnitrophota bacterium]